MSLAGRATGGDLPPIDRAEVMRAVGLMVDPSHGVMIQQLKSGALTHLPGDCLDDIADQVEAYSRNEHVGIYYTVNPVSGGSGKSGGALVGDVVRRRWLFLDFDRDKTHDRDGSATSGEKEAAGWALDSFVDLVCGRFRWPDPITIDSGNGFHAYFRVELPNDDESQTLMRDVLKAANYYLSGYVDMGTHNANRIARLPGTWARKGPNTMQRPHRQCRLMRVPEQVELLTSEQMREFVEQIGEKKGKPAEKAPPPERLSDLAGRATGGDESNGRNAYAKAALAAEYRKLAEAIKGERHNQLIRSAAALFEFVAGGDLRADEVEAEIRAACLINGMAEEDGSEKEIASALDWSKHKTANSPREIPDRQQPAPKLETNGQHTTNGDGKPHVEAEPGPSAASQRQPPTIVQLSALLTMEFPEPRWAVPGILAEGMTFLGGKPKQGKSWLGLNLGITIAAGGLALGSIPTTPGDVLYLALEDRGRRLQTRARTVLPGLGVEASPRMYFATEWPRSDKGGLFEIERWMKSVPRPTLVVIDVWSKFAEPTTSKGAAQEEDYKRAAPIKALADKYGCSILIIHHVKKGSNMSDDYLEDIAGSMGLTGAADTTIVLRRNRGEDDAVLHMTGRDINDQELAIKFCPKVCCWTEQGDAKEKREGDVQKAILAFLDANRGRFYSAGDIAANLRTGSSADSVRVICVRLDTAGKVIRHKTKAAWAVPNKQPPDDDDAEAF